MYLPDLLKLSTLLSTFQQPIFPESQAAVDNEYTYTYSSLNFFKQYQDNSSITIQLPNFGLLNQYSWNSLILKLNSLNNQSDFSKYKLFFIARHGESWHNVLNTLPNWYEISKNDTFENYTLFDDDLTPNGLKQIEKVNQYWLKNLKHGIDDHDHVPWPDTFFVSPLRRTLHTFNITWSNLSQYNDINQSINPIVVESLRERYGISKPERRHMKKWIKSYCLNCKFFEPFTENDELWEFNSFEKNKHVEKRIKNWINDIFANEYNDFGNVISITSHSNTIKQFLKIVKHPKYKLDTGGIIPVVVRQDKIKN